MPPSIGAWQSAANGTPLVIAADQLRPANMISEKRCTAKCDALVSTPLCAFLNLSQWPAAQWGGKGKNPAHYSFSSIGEFAFFHQRHITRDSAITAPPVRCWKRRLKRQSGESHADTIGTIHLNCLRLRHNFHAI